VRSQPPGLMPNPTFLLASSPVSPVDRARLLTASSRAGCQEWHATAVATDSKNLNSAEADFTAPYMLGIWCQTYSTMIDAQEKLNQAGTLYKSKGGFVQASPLFGIVIKCVHVMSKISSEFGLTPSARVRLHSTPEAKSANKWADVG
jgi:P27 family predicted phage terminase small subunit